MTQAAIEFARRLAIMLEALFDAIDRLIRKLFRLPEPARSRGAWAAFESATCAGVDAVIKTHDAGVEFGVVKPALSLARAPGAMVRGAAAAGRFAGGAVLGVAGAVGDVLGALAPARPVSPTDLARQAVAADDAPMPSARPVVSSRPRLGDGRSTPYLLQGAALGVAVQDFARARAMGDASVGRVHPDVPKEVLSWVFNLSHTQLAAVSRLPAAVVHDHVTGKAPAPGLPPAPPPQSIAALPLYSPDELTAMAHKAMAYMRRESAEAGRIAEAASRRRLVGEPEAGGPALAL
ncbi:hypothetical protein [Methylobacterium aquaticum]|uniref:Uncharacterized protein n=1 Tax=Methylobacterium aquaticum TaxID=270351 RepID=A0A0C6FRA2_9HYPH|nr:hypothetical protein [Methylobacterium aquaticum]BAQ49602.1 hypothetical protein Maq22A_1p37050 [Methylobacterium aquaticum]